MKSFNEYYELREDFDLTEEILSFENEIKRIVESHPSKSMSEKNKSDYVKRAKRGEDIFGGGKNFEKIAKKAGKKYGSKEAGKRVAGAIFWSKARKKGMFDESNTDDLIWIIEDDIKLILDSVENRNAKK